MKIDKTFSAHWLWRKLILRIKLVLLLNVTTETFDEMQLQGWSTASIAVLFAENNFFFTSEESSRIGCIKRRWFFAVLTKKKKRDKQNIYLCDTRSEVSRKIKQTNLDRLDFILAFLYLENSFTSIQRNIFRVNEIYHYYFLSYERYEQMKCWCYLEGHGNHVVDRRTKCLRKKTPTSVIWMIFLFEIGMKRSILNRLSLTRPDEIVYSWTTLFFR
jgi:hypothetical protein